MAESKVKSGSDESLVERSPQPAAGSARACDDHEGERADFELDDVLRGLALERWFATASRDVPVWAF